LVTFELPKMLL